MSIHSINIPVSTIPVQQAKENPTPKRTPQKSIREIMEMPDSYCVKEMKLSNGYKLSPEEIFDIQYESATPLSDGSKLIRPVCLSLGRVNIRPIRNGKEYFVHTIPTFYSNQGTHGKVMTEDELLSSKIFCRGNIKEGDKKGTYVINYTDSNGKEHTCCKSKKGCLDLLQENFLYM